MQGVLQLRPWVRVGNTSMEGTWIKRSDKGKRGNRSNSCSSRRCRWPWVQLPTHHELLLAAQTTTQQ